MNTAAITKTRSMNRLLRSALLSPVLLLTLAIAQPMRSFAAPAAREDAYAAGTRAMNQQRWNDAVADFDKVIDARARRTDAALYWKAYSLNKLGNGQLALATCARLQALYRDSRWNNDCSALSIGLNPNMNMDIHIDPKAISDSIKMSVNSDAINASVKAAIDQAGIPAGVHIHGHDDPNEDIKILALNSLLRQDPAKALPILRGILTGNNSSESMKRHALFVLAQSKSPEAQSILHDAVTGKIDPALQRQAIESMAIFQGKRDNDTLAEIYRTATDPGVKRAVINAFFISHDAPRLVELARNEKDLETKRDIVSKLALMHDKAATDYMLELLK